MLAKSMLMLMADRVKLGLEPLRSLRQLIALAFNLLGLLLVFTSALDGGPPASLLTPWCR
jgi:hypothetical protein